jgi:phage-related protein
MKKEDIKELFTFIVDQLGMYDGGNNTFDEDLEVLYNQFGDSCSKCVHKCHLINQGVHWCGLQKETYPEVCKDYEETPKGTITTN